MTRPPQVSTREETLASMRQRLAGIVPDDEITAKAEIAHQINQLKIERNAVILGHNYMEPALYHSVPDYTGDSLQLSIVSSETDADIILFCGVWFMGETAKVICPEKTVLVPARQAGCSLAAGITAEDVRMLKAKFRGVPTVTYVNTYADVKAECDYCCTSGNADKVVQYLLDQGHKHILFLPDEFLARNTAHALGVDFIAYDAIDAEGLKTQGPALIGWKARCEVHELFTTEDIEAIRSAYPEAVILAHPECPPDVMAKIDIGGSTKKMVEYVRDVDAAQYALLTECSMSDNLAAQFPDRHLVRSCARRCPHMELITLEDTLEALEKTQCKVELPAEIIEKARTPIVRMLAIR